MELKEMLDIVVVISNSKERVEYLTLCQNSGWQWGGSGHLPLDWEHPSLKFPYYISARKSMSNGGLDNTTKVKITLADFRKEQGIMKYKQGDVFNYCRSEVKILAVCGGVYCLSDSNDFSEVDGWVTEEWLDKRSYTLKTDTPTKTDMTVAEIAKKLGMKPEELNVVADK